MTLSNSLSALLGQVLLAGFLFAVPLPAFAGAGGDVTEICTGDGNGVACPCNNTGTTPGAGCLNGSGTSALLSTNGDNAVSSNDLSFGVSGATPLSFALLVSGDNAFNGGLGIVGMPVFDGLRCVGVNALRHGTRATDLFGDNLNPWGTGAGIIAQSGFVAGQTRHFQARYREDPLTSPCGSDQNTSQGISVTFVQDPEPCTAAVQMSCIAAGNEPCTVGVNSADCGPPTDPCTQTIIDDCVAMGLQGCVFGTGSAACGGPVGDLCTSSIINACFAAGLSACMPGSFDCGPPCTCGVNEALACLASGANACVFGGNCQCT